MTISHIVGDFKKAKAAEAAVMAAAPAITAVCGVGSAENG